jgi:hypothetical protein
MGKGNILTPLDRVEELETRMQDIPLVLLNGSWVREEDENGELLYYRQDVEVKGLSADSTPIILPKWAGDEPTEEESFAYDCLIGEPIITEGNIRFMANPMPQWSFTMVAKGAMASEGQDIDAVANLVAKVNELETEVDELNRNIKNTPLCLEFTKNLATSENNQILTVTYEIDNTINASDYILSNIYISYQYGSCVTTIRRYWISGNTVSIEFTATIKQQAATAHIILTKKTLA